MKVYLDTHTLASCVVLLGDQGIDWYYLEEDKDLNCWKLIAWLRRN